MAALLLVIAYGTTGYVVVAGFSPLDALFMTVITITTVGYEEVHHLGAAGQVFTMTLIGFGVIGFLYTFGVLVELLSSGRWQEYRRDRRMAAELRSRRDHTIVCGYGRTGKQVVDELRQSGEPYVVVEMNPEPLADVVRDAQPHVVGDAASDEILQEAGIDRARSLVSAVDSDERNVYIVLTARSLKPDLFIVARSSFPDSAPKLRRAGADRVVSPYTLSGRRMAALAVQPAVVDVLDTMLTGEVDGVNLEELRVPESVAGVTVAELRRTGAVLLALVQAGRPARVNPDDAAALDSGDMVVAMGTRDQLRALATVMSPRPADR